MKYSILLLVLLFSTLAYCQDDEETEDNDSKYTGTFQGSELGIDIGFSASTNGGNAGLGLKYGAKLGEYVILGPSVRYDLTWIKNQVGGLNGNYSVYGGGAFIHGRFFNALFVGAEF